MSFQRLPVDLCLLKKKWRRKEGKLKKGGRNKERRRNAKIDLKTVGNKRRKK